MTGRIILKPQTALIAVGASPPEVDSTLNLEKLAHLFELKTSQVSPKGVAESVMLI